MKLVHPDFEFHIELPKEEIIHLIIENPSCFYKYSQELMKQIQGEEGKFILSDESKLLSINKDMSTVLSPFLIDTNQKPIVNRAISLIKEEILSTAYLETLKQVNDILSQMIENAAVSLNFSINYEQVTDISTLLKVMSIDFEEIDNLTLIEKLIEYINTVSNIMSVKMFAFCNFAPYLSDSDYSYLHELCEYEKITILLIDNEDNELFKGQKYIIDKDLCEII